MEDRAVVLNEDKRARLYTAQNAGITDKIYIGHNRNKRDRAFSPWTYRARRRNPKRVRVSTTLYLARLVNEDRREEWLSTLSRTQPFPFAKSAHLYPGRFEDAIRTCDVAQKKRQILTFDRDPKCRTVSILRTSVRPLDVVDVVDFEKTDFEKSFLYRKTILSKAHQWYYSTDYDASISTR